MNTIFEASLISNLLSIIDKSISSGLDQQFVKEYCQGVLNIPNPTNGLIKKIKTYYIHNQNLPEDIEGFARWDITSCLCGLITPDLINIATTICSQVIQSEGRVPNCNLLLLHIEYYRQENRVATSEELIEYLHNLQTIHEDPERFHQENKMKIPTPNLNLLQPSTNCKVDNCGLCFEEITEGENCFKLPCNHIFHCDEEKCLNTTIKTWLSQNKCCPICKTEVLLP